MSITLPPINAKITGDLSALRESLTQAKAEAKAAATAIKSETQQIAKQVASNASDPVFGPSAKPRFDAMEQQVREGMAKSIRAMRDAAQAANVNDEVQLRLYGPKQAAADVERIEEAVAAVKTEVASASAAVAAEGRGGFFAGLNSTLGRGSDAGMLGRLLTGGGPILAASLITNALKSATEEAKNLVTQFRAGEIDASQMVVKIQEAVPVWGNVASAIANIHEAITGDQAAIKAANDEAKASVELSDAMRSNFVEAAKATNEIGQIIRNLKTDISLVNANDFTKKMVSTVREAAGQIKNVASESDAAINTILNPSNRPSLDALQKQAKEIKQKIAAVYIPSPEFGFGVSESEKAEYFANPAKSFIQPANKDAIDAAKRSIADLQRAMSPINFEIKDREQDAAVPIAKSRVAAVLAAAKGGLELAKVWKDTAKEAGEAWLKMFPGGTHSQFRAIQEAKQDLTSVVQSIKQQGAILGGRFDHQDFTEAMMKVRRASENKIDTIGMLKFADEVKMGTDLRSSLHAKEYHQDVSDPGFVGRMMQEMQKFEQHNGGGGSRSDGPTKATDQNTKETVDLLKQLVRQMDFEVINF